MDRKVIHKNANIRIHLFLKTGSNINGQQGNDLINHGNSNKDVEKENQTDKKITKKKKIMVNPYNEILYSH